VYVGFVFCDFIFFMVDGIKDKVFLAFEIQKYVMPSAED
jgi:hypothetical protein